MTGLAVQFQHRMAALGPFEPAPHLAVAVSGGADSLALALLADAWVRERGGRVTAFCVDHGLATETASVCADVSRALEARGIENRVLTHAQAPPESGLEAYARSVRYRLLRRACAELGILHLLVGHTRDDQAETLLLRLGAGSGADGLAAMRAVLEWPEVQVLRPLLSASRAETRAFAEAAGLRPWDDPMNADPRFRRVRVRAALGTLAEAGLSVERLCEAADGFARARAALEADAARLAALAVTLHPLGYASVDAARLERAEDEVRARLFARVLGAVGGREYPPSPPRAGAFLSRLNGGGGRGTLAGCVAEVRNGVLRVFRECRGTAEWTIVEAGRGILWDGRFPVRAPAAGAIRVRLTGDRAVARDGVPMAALRALPHVDGPPGAAVGPFRPRISLSGPGACVV